MSVRCWGKVSLCPRGGRHEEGPVPWGAAPPQERGAALSTPRTKGLSCLNSLGRVPGRAPHPAAIRGGTKAGSFLRGLPLYLPHRKTHSSVCLLGGSINVEGRPESQQIKGR